MNPKGRPPILSDAEKQDKILDVIVKGGSARMAARAPGVHLQTLERFLRDDPDFRARFDQAQSDYKSEMVACIQAAAKTNPRAAAWLRDHRPTRQTPDPNVPSTKSKVPSPKNQAPATDSSHEPETAPPPQCRTR